ncbi:MAG TPA: type II secretion system protein F [Halieaceae bacterium]|nr:type II secretion system protein F [Halieaceae bacterium]
MPEFSYKAAQKDGSIVQGTLAASNHAAALRQLRGQGLTPVRVWSATGAEARLSKPAPPFTAAQSAPASSPGRAGGPSSTSASGPAGAGRTGRGFRWPSRRGEFVGRDEVLALTSELAVLLRAGLPIDRALKVQMDMSTRPAYTELLRRLLETVKSGKPLSHGLETDVELFGNFYVNMVRAGEASGQLGVVFERLGEYLHRSKEVRDTVVSALIYPAILAVVAVLSVAVMLGFVVPQFEALFADMGEGLPGLTRAVIAMGDVVRGWGWLLLLMFGLAYYGLRSWLAGAEGRSWWDQRMLRLPILGGVLFKYEVARFARTLGTLLGNGVPLLQSIGVAMSTVENSTVRQALSVLPPAVKAGRRVSDALSDGGVFTPLVIQMTRVGEESGRLDEMMLELARVYDRDVESGVKRGLTLLEPLLILGMGGIIALIIVSILMGILSVNDLAM